MNREIQITEEGLAEVKRELAQLIEEQRPYIAEKIKVAREMGDLSENAEYHAAKDQQGFIEARIAELETIVKNAVIMRATDSGGRVDLLTTVTFREGDGPEETYTIVGPTEADPAAGRISFESPIARALMGNRAGDTVEVKTPTGATYTVTITCVK